MSQTWLCKRKTSKLLYLLLVLMIQMTSTCIAQKETKGYISNIRNSANKDTKRNPTISMKHNSLMDDLAHEEFIDEDAKQPHSRRKRLVWITDDGRLALPPGTSLTFTPTIAMPLVRHPPEGFFSNVSISFPVTIDFDKLGLTDNQNPLGDLPPIFARSFGHSTGKILGQYMARYLNYKAKRDLAEQTKLKMSTNTGFHIKESYGDDEAFQQPVLPERYKHIFHGGERVMLYGVVEDFLSTFGLDGKACLLRTICEVHSRNIEHFGVFGEMTKLFLTVTKSPFSELIPEYVRAQEIGEGRQAPGECFPFYKGCPKGIFRALQKDKYSESQKGEYHEQEAEELKNNDQQSSMEENKTNEIKFGASREMFSM